MPLAEACEKITDGTHHSPPIQPAGIPYVTAKHIKADGPDFFSDPWFVSENDHREIFSRCDPRPGDVLYIKDGATTGIAAVNRYAFEFSMLSSVALLRPRAAVLTPEFLCHWLNAPLVKRRILGGMAGVAIRRLTLEKINAIRVPLPPAPEQRRIAAILDKADELRAKRRAAISKLDSLTQAIFLDMFGDPVRNDRGWPITPVGHFVAGFETGKSLMANDEDDGSTGLRVLKVSAVTSLRFRPEESKALPPDYVPPPSHFVRKGDLLFSRANTQELIGATALVEDAPEGLVLPDKLWRFTWHGEPRADPHFVHWLFRQPRFRFELGRRATGTSGSMKNISQEKVLDIKVTLPGLSLQRKFGRIAYAINRLRQAGEEALSTTDTAFASLQHRAFRGQL